MELHKNRLKKKFEFKTLEVFNRNINQKSNLAFAHRIYQIY
mgnify:CR=1 FL=1